MNSLHILSYFLIHFQILCDPVSMSHKKELALLNCSNDITEIISKMVLTEGDNTVCHFKGSDQLLVAVVKDKKIIKWKTINPNGVSREAHSKIISKKYNGSGELGANTTYQPKKGKKKSASSSAPAPLELSLGPITVCTTISGTLDTGESFSITTCVTEKE